jgi:short-subunit dehydrogenase
VRGLRIGGRQWRRNVGVSDDHDRAGRRGPDGEHIAEPALLLPQPAQGVAMQAKGLGEPPGARPGRKNGRHVGLRTRKWSVGAQAFAVRGCLLAGPGSATDMDTTKSLAVITGASSGIGLELAKQFATNNYDLLIAAEDAELATASEELRALGADVEAVQVDLAADGGVDELYGRIRANGRPVDAIALNAGIGAGGSFAGPDEDRTPLEQELAIIDLNVRSTVHLAKHVIGDMVARDAGRVLFTSSIASTMPGAFQAVYNASKSFIQSFALAIRNELKDTNVTITLLMPGPTDTEFFERADMLDTKIGADEKDDPADVARDGFEALMAGKERVVSASLKTKVQGRAGRFMPDSAKAELHRKMAEPGSGKS